MKQALDLSEYLLLVGGPARRRKGIVAISRKASRKIAPVIRIVAACHSDLISSIDLRNPAQGKEKSKSKVQLFWRRARLAHEARVIVIAKEGHKPLRMRKQPVMREDFFQQLRRPVLQDNLAQGRAKRKVEHCIHSGIDPCRRFTSGKIGSDHRIRSGDFANGFEAGIGGVNRGVEIVPEAAVDIRKCIEPEAIERAGLRPPESILAKI